MVVKRAVVEVDVSSSAEHMWHDKLEQQYEGNGVESIFGRCLAIVIRDEYDGDHANRGCHQP